MPERVPVVVREPEAHEIEAVLACSEAAYSLRYPATTRERLIAQVEAGGDPLEEAERAAAAPQQQPGQGQGKPAEQAQQQPAQGEQQMEQAQDQAEDTAEQAEGAAEEADEQAVAR